MSSSPRPTSQAAPLALTVLILLAAWALRVHALGAKSLWYDELRQVEIALHPLDEFAPLIIAQAARPLDYVITHFMLLFAGPADGPAGRAEFWLRFPAALWGVLSVAVFVPLARRWLSRRAAWAAVAMLAAAPLAVQYSQELRPYSFYLLCALLSFYCLDCALGLGRRPQRAPVRSWLGFAALSAAGMLTHFFYIFLLFAQAVFVGGLFVAEWLAARRRPARQPKVGWRGLAAFAAGVAAGIGALFVDFPPLHAALYARDFLGALFTAPVTGGITVDTGATLQIHDAINADFLFRGLLPFFGGGEGPALVLFGGLVLIGLAVFARRDLARLAQGALWLLLAPALVIVYLEYRAEFFALRYILFMLPIYLMLAAAGLAAVAGGVGRLWRAVRFAPSWEFRPGPALFGAGLVLLVFFQLGRVQIYYHLPKDDWRRVGQFLTANTRPGDTLGAPDVQAFIRFYAPHQAATIVDANDLGPHQEALADGERFWFVVSDYTLLPVQETQQWAESQPGVTIQLDPLIRVVFIHPGLTTTQTLDEASHFVIPPSTNP